MKIHVSPVTAVTLYIDGLLVTEISFSDICHDTKAATLWMENDLPFHIEAFIDVRFQLMILFRKMSADVISMFMTTYKHYFNRIDLIAVLLNVYKYNPSLQPIINYMLDEEIKESEMSETSLMLYILSSTNLASYHKDYCNSQLLNRVITFIEESAKQSKETSIKINNIGFSFVTIGDYEIHSYMIRLAKCIKNLMIRGFHISQIEYLFNLKKVWENDYELFYNEKTFDLEIRQKDDKSYWSLTETDVNKRDPHDFIGTNLIFE